MDPVVKDLAKRISDTDKQQSIHMGLREKSFNLCLLPTCLYGKPSHIVAADCQDLTQKMTCVEVSKPIR